MSKLTDRQKGYLEGFIDADGCICFYKNKNNFILEVSIANTNLKLLKYIKKLLKSGQISTRKIYMNNAKQSYDYKFSNETLRILLPQIKFRIKEKQRKIAIKILKIQDKRRHGFGRWKHNWGVKYLERYKIQLNKLNKKGVK